MEILFKHFDTIFLKEVELENSKAVLHLLGERKKKINFAEKDLNSLYHDLLYLLGQLLVKAKYLHSLSRYFFPPYSPHRQKAYFFNTTFKANSKQTVNGKATMIYYIFNL